MAKETVEKTKKTNAKYTFAVGRRREAVARVRLYSTSVELFGNEYHKGDVVVNKKPIGQYFGFKSYHPIFKKIFDDTGALNNFVYSISVRGGGISGQLDAVVLGIARALTKFDTDKYKVLLKEKGYMTRDARTRERRKVGMGGKARRAKQSPKR